ncbi:hypothetical protein [Carnobacterium jeotgali]|uniref:hypothetical protein n=1 Tax=Carnobacterium jeotgali TaxID=545534 RepID=UPI000B32BE4B|nr:hypothetical protein [Carnobacterium jeotgali]
MSKCNHPECIDGVMHESLGFGITSIYKCPYCATDKKKSNWSKSETAVKLKSFIDKRGE